MFEAHHKPATVTQTDIPGLRWAGRLQEHAHVQRTVRHQLGGGFGDQAKYPYTWSVFLVIDGESCQIMSARGAPRAWSSLDRLERWLREQGFRRWTVSNDLEAVGDDDPAELAPAPPSGIK